MPNPRLRRLASPARFLRYLGGLNPPRLAKAMSQSLMKRIASLAGVFLILLGLAGMIRPGALMDFGYQVLTPLGLYAAAALRISIGLVLVLAATRSRWPRTLRVLGCIILGVGMATALMGVDRARAALDWWSAQGWVIIRLPYLMASVIGVFITQVLTAIHRDD